MLLSSILMSTFGIRRGQGNLWNSNETRTLQATEELLLDNDVYVTFVRGGRSRDSWFCFNQGDELSGFVSCYDGAFDFGISTDNQAVFSAHVETGANRTISLTVPSSGTYQVSAQLDGTATSSGHIKLSVVRASQIPSQTQSSILTDFENGMKEWSVLTQIGATSEINATFAHSGGHSLELVASENGSWEDDSVLALRRPVLQNQDAYEISTWVCVTERSSVFGESSFGFVYGNESVGFNVNGYGGYVQVRESEGFAILGFTEPYFIPDFYHVNGYNLESNIWHQINVSAYTLTGRVSVWYDGQLLAYNWPAFTVNETPSYYYIGCHLPWQNGVGVSIVGTLRQFVDDVTVDVTGSVPEFPSLVIPALFLVMTLITLSAWKRLSRVPCGARSKREFIISNKSQK